MNNSSRLGHRDSSCLVPGPGMIKAEDYCLLEGKNHWSAFQSVGSGFVGLHVKNVLTSKLFTISRRGSPSLDLQGPKMSKHHKIQRMKNMTDTTGIQIAVSSLSLLHNVRTSAGRLEH